MIKLSVQQRNKAEIKVFSSELERVKSKINGTQGFSAVQEAEAGKTIIHKKDSLLLRILRGFGSKHESGSVSRLPNGDVVVNYTTKDTLQEIAALAVEVDKLEDLDLQQNGFVFRSSRKGS